jgi:hypothetical protein
VFDELEWYNWEWWNEQLMSMLCFGYGILVKKTLENIHVRTWLCIAWQHCDELDEIIEKYMILVLVHAR